MIELSESRLRITRVMLNSPVPSRIILDGSGVGVGEASPPPEAEGVEVSIKNSVFGDPVPAKLASWKTDVYGTESVTVKVKVSKNVLSCMPSVKSP